MTDNRELEVAFAKRGIKKNVVAKELGISLNSLRRKAINQMQFKADEICKLIKILNLTEDELIAIFFKEEINGNKKPRGAGRGRKGRKRMEELKRILNGDLSGQDLEVTVTYLQEEQAHA